MRKHRKPHPARIILASTFSPLAEVCSFMYS
jgi:hypothetical protein